jgi:hypothetical protein
LRGQAFCAHQISRGRVDHMIDDAGGEHFRHNALKLGGVRVERQRVLLKCYTRMADPDGDQDQRNIIGRLD